MELVRSKFSRRILLRLAWGASATALASHTSAARGQGPPDRNATFQNPLFPGDYADPSIARVGDDFYLTHTSYRYAPGLVVWHSRDLVNWLPISSALPRTYGEVWAPDFVEHQGHYFIYFPLDGRLTVVHAADPRGPWSKPIDLRIGDIDPGHVVAPDGTRFLYSAGGKVAQLSPDGLSVVGDQKLVYDGWRFPKEWKTEGFWLESPKLTRRGDFFYLTSAEGGTAGPPTSHMAVVARSRSPLGPWENSPYNPLTHTYSEGETWWSVGHGTLVSTPDDRWYFVYHGYRNGFQSLGRHILLEPVEWTADGWPRAPVGAERDLPMRAPMGVAPSPMIPLSDDFRGPQLRATWGVWNETDMSRFQTGQGSLTIRAKSDSPGRSSPVTVMARHEKYEVRVVATPDGSGAALGLFYSPNHCLFAELKGGQLRVATAKETLASCEWQANSAHLRIVNRRNRIEFSAGENGRDWSPLLSDFDASGYVHNKLGAFQALRPALAAGGVGQARFLDFQYRIL